MSTIRWPFALIVAAGLVAALAFGVRGAFTQNAPAANPQSNGRAGEMLLVNGYVQEPAGGAAAAGADLPVYGWLFNDGQRDDRLLSVSSPAAESVSRASGKLPADLPAQEWLPLGPTDSHLVLRGLTRPVRAGRTVELTFTFARNEPLTVRVAAVQRESAATPTAAP